MIFVVEWSCFSINLKVWRYFEGILEFFIIFNWFCSIKCSHYLEFVEFINLFQLILSNEIFGDFFLTDHLFHWFWLIEFSTTEISCISQQIVSCFCWTHHLFQLMLMSWFNFFPLQRSAVYPNKLFFFVELIIFLINVDKLI